MKNSKLFSKAQIGTANKPKGDSSKNIRIILEGFNEDEKHYYIKTLHINLDIIKNGISKIYLVQKDKKLHIYGENAYLENEGNFKILWIGNAQFDPEKQTILIGRFDEEDKRRNHEIKNLFEKEMKGLKLDLLENKS